MQQNFSMKDFQSELDASFKEIKEGDLLKGTVISVSEEGILVDINYYMEGFIPAPEVSNDPTFPIQFIHSGDEVTATVLSSEDDYGYVLLSLKQASELLAWEKLAELKENETVFPVKVYSAVNSGVVAYVEGIRGFIPISKLSLDHIDDVTPFIGQTIDVIIITLDPSNKKLILSHKDVEYTIVENERNNKISKLQKGSVITGTIDKIVPYGAFITIKDGLSGLIHISQICQKRIKSPNEVLKLGQEVTAKIIDIKDGKISLSIIAAEEESTVDNNDDTIEPFTYSTGEEATTGLSALLKNIKL